MAMGDKQAPSSEAHKACPSSLPGPRATYPQLSHVPCTGQHTASRTTRRRRKSIAASDMRQLQGRGLVATSTAADVLPAEFPLPGVPLDVGLMSQSAWFRVLGVVVLGGWGGVGWGRGVGRGGEGREGRQ